MSGSHEPGPITFPFVSPLPLTWWVGGRDGPTNVQVNTHCPWGFSVKTPIFFLLFVPWDSPYHPADTCLTPPRTAHSQEGGISLMKASKHQPMCPKGGSPNVLLPWLNQGKLCQEEGHTLTDSPNNICMSQAPSKQADTEVYYSYARQSQQICLFGLPSSTILGSLSLELSSWDPSFVPDINSQNLWRAHQTPFFTECPQCIGLKSNAELDYCTWPVGSHFKQINRQIDRGELSRKEGGNILQGEAGAGEGKPVRAGHLVSLSRTGSSTISDPAPCFWSARGRANLNSRAKDEPHTSSL